MGGTDPKLKCDSSWGGNQNGLPGRATLFAIIIDQGSVSVDCWLAFRWHNAASCVAFWMLVGLGTRGAWPDLVRQPLGASTRPLCE